MDSIPEITSKSFVGLLSETFNLLSRQGAVHTLRNQAVPHWEPKINDGFEVIHAKLNGFGPMMAGDRLVDNDGQNYLVLSAELNPGIGIAGNYVAELMPIIKVNQEWRYGRPQVFNPAKSKQPALV